MMLLAHRGLDIGILNPESESSLASFESCLEKGFGLELDLQMTKDNQLVIGHDADLVRWSSGFNKKLISSLTYEELIQQTKNRPILRLEGLLDLHRSEGSSALIAIHWKAENQKKPFAEAIFKTLSAYKDVWERFLIFDVKPEWGQWLRDQMSSLHLAPSVAHEHDIKRFSKMTGNTLVSLSEALEFKWADWLWLDEWDLKGPDKTQKSLYNEETFHRAQAAKKQTVVISPELHEGHEERADLVKLEQRWRMLSSWNASALCTDYSSRVKGHLGDFHVQA